MSVMTQWEAGILRTAQALAQLVARRDRLDYLWRQKRQTQQIRR
jgi:hypothetical protein